MGVTVQYRSAARARVVLVVLLALFALIGCGGNPTNVRSVSLRMRGGPARATVTIDDRRVGPLDVVAEGCIPWDKEIEATEAPVVLDVTLEPLPD
jgi:hypothetical protein